MSAGRPCAAALVGACLAAGCSPVSLAIGAGASAGVALAEERTVEEVVDDARIVTEINQAWLAEDFALMERFNTAVHQGRVLITGTAETPEQMLLALRLAWQVDGVQEVINEIQVGEGDGIAGFTRDQELWLAVLGL